MISTSLPLPDTNALNHSQAVLRHILSTIKHNAHPISFARFMDLALYAPGLGYYSVGTQKFGKGGDFVTAPELSPLFSRCLAHQCAEILQHLGSGDILEIGAGSGQMAVDILIALAQLETLPKHYYILEVSADLKTRQQEKIMQSCPQLLDRVAWINELPSNKFQGVILANEVLDAMPVERFLVDASHTEVYEIGVGIDEKFDATVDLNGNFHNPLTQNHQPLKFLHAKTNIPEILELVQARAWPKHIPYTSEINLSLKPWIASLSDSLKAGAILLIDYGFTRDEYYHPDRHMGTLMCHYRHYAHSDPFWYPGLQDITAHVDFTAVAEAAMDANLEILGYTHQAAFLLACGLTELAENAQTMAKRQAMNVLTSPAEMGELFKVIALGRGIELSLLGFSLMDRRYSL